MTRMIRLTKINGMVTVTGASRGTRMSGIVCITGALSAKQGERGILREAQDERGNKLSASYQPLLWLFPRSLHECCYDELFWRDSGCLSGTKLAVTHSSSFDDAVQEAFRLFPNVPEIKEKQKKCLNLLLNRKVVLGLFPTWFMEKPNLLTF